MFDISLPHPDHEQIPPHRYHGDEVAFEKAFDPVYKMGHTSLLKAVHEAQEKRGERVKRK